MRVLHEVVRRASGGACFGACPERQQVGADAPYNTTSPCYTSCFYDALLGPHADGPAYAGGGMSAEAVADAWLAGFDECPEYEEDGAGVAEADEAKGAIVRAAARRGGGKRALLPQ